MSSDEGWLQAPHTLAEETPTRKSQPPEKVSFSQRQLNRIADDAVDSVRRVSPDSPDASDSSSVAPELPLSVAFERSVKRAIDLSSGSSVPLVVDADAFELFAHRPVAHSSTGSNVSRLVSVSRVKALPPAGAAPVEIVLSDDDLRQHDDGDDGFIARRSAGAAQQPKTKKSRILSDDDDTPLKAPRSSAPSAKKQRKAPRIVDSDDDGGGGGGAGDDNDADVDNGAGDDGVEVVHNNNNNNNNNDDDEKTEEDDALDSDERELIEVDSLVHQCESYTEALALGGGTGEAVRTIAQPKRFVVPLRNYQLVGLNWLALLHSKQLNGILADEMGLGKTAQTIAFLTHLLEVGDAGPHLVVAPASTLHNWARELTRFAPTLRVVVYHGTLKEREAAWQGVIDAQRKQSVAPNVVVTTYNILGGKLDKNFFKSFQWSYLVLDEAHAIKNPKSKRYQDLSRMATRAKRRLLLTGTPLQNNLTELFALLNFLMPDVLQYEHLTRILNAPRLRSHAPSEPSEPSSVGAAPERASAQDVEEAYIRRAKKILNPFILRRLKEHVSKELPPKIDVVQPCDMPPAQRAAYQALLASSKRSLAGTLGADGTAATTLDATPADDNADADDEDRVLDVDDDDDGAAAKRKTAAANKKKAAAAAADVRSPMRRRQSGGGGGGGGGGEKKQNVSNVLMQMRKMSNHPLLCRAIFDDARVERVARALCDSGVDEFHAYPLHELIEDLKINSDFEIWRLCESYGGRALLAETPPRSVLVQDAGKMQRLMQLLPPLVAAGTKSLIFSQMTRMLDILEVVLQDANIAFVRLDGQTPINERMQLIDRFNNEPKLSIFLLSTRAGGLGINLTAATEVFFYDYGFNPQVERQAEDRCHRLGQEHQVTVTRLVLQKSIDENILQLATDKTRLNDMMLEEGKFVAAEEANHQRKLERSILQKILQQAE